MNTVNTVNITNTTNSVNSMRLAVVDAPILYDGSQINPLWAYEYLDVRGDSIVVFRGAMAVSDIKDVEDEKNNNAIEGSDLIHFIVERFDSPAGIRQAYYLQRMLVVCIQDVLMNYDVSSERNGDDLFVDGKKLTVSIATAGISSEKIHCGINLTGRGTPPEANATGLHELKIDPDLWKDIGKAIAERFVFEIEDIESDICKTRCLNSGKL
ncbi:MAG: DUF366 family protein [Methanosarcinales archaeon]|nr:DUF366 family protein [Methanosarcinales archaeon]MCK4811236.1 DUF366 family protein [Methanosarcinales archaeon]